MAINNISLRKLLRLFYMPPSQLTSALRTDIRAEIRTSNSVQSGGGDFYVPFWNDAKMHVAGLIDLSEQTQIRIASNSGRSRLYPQLEEGFLLWWNEKRRWSNQEFELFPDAVKGYFQVPNLDATVKIENILALSIDDNTDRLIYPYFSEEPQLQAEGARIGLWLLDSALEKYEIDDIRILDIFRAQSFSVSEFPLQGNEEEFFMEKYRYILKKWETLWEEYK